MLPLSFPYALLGVDIVAPRRPELFTAFATHPCDRADYSALIGGRKLTTVFHLAGAASVPQSVENPVGDFVSLLPGTVTLLAHLGKFQKDAHLILFSSAAVYGNPKQLPITEADELSPISPYGIHKATAEFAIAHYARLFGFRASLLRIFSAYGEGLRKQVVWDLCQRAMTALREGRREITLHGTGNETRDFVHVADVAQAGLLAAKNPPTAGTQILNVASGVETTIRSLAEGVRDNLGGDLQLAFNGVTRAGDPVNWRADVSRLQALGFNTTVPFADGIARCVRWQKNLAAENSIIS